MTGNKSEEALIALIQRLRAEPEFYFENCLKIQRFGTGELAPFTLNPVQKILHHMMERQLKELEHVRMIVLKARRFGMSTYVQGRYFRHAALNKNRVVQITTHSKAATDVMFSMPRTMEQHLPKEVKPQMKYSGKRELHWGSDGGGLNSSYSLSTVGGREVRGSKIDYLHCSEVASWGPSGEDYLLGLLNCVVQGFHTVGRQLFFLGISLSTTQMNSAEKRSESNSRTVLVKIPDTGVKRNLNSWVWDANTTSGWMTTSILLLPSKT